MPYKTFDDDYVYLQTRDFTLAEGCVRIFIDSNHFGYNITRDIFEYITRVLILDCECDFELDENEDVDVIHVNFDSRFNGTFINLKIELKKDVLLIKELYCVSVGRWISKERKMYRKMYNADRLTLQDECEFQKLTDDTPHYYEYAYVCRCNYTVGGPYGNLILYDEMDNVLFDGTPEYEIVRDIINKKKNTFLTFKYSRISHPI